MNARHSGVFSILAMADPRKMRARIGALRAHGVMWAYYKTIFLRNILKTKPIVCDKEGQFELHTLACEQDFLNSLWALKTFYYFAELRPPLVIYDDGSLTEASLAAFAEHFPGCRIVGRDRFDRDMEHFLKAYPISLSYSRMRSFYCALKLFGPMYYPQSEYVLSLDSDVLFFKRPGELLRHIENGTAFYNNDYQDAYSYPVDFLKNRLKVEVGHKINSGLTYLAKRDFAGSMDLVESYFGMVAETSKSRGPPSWHEQTATAMLLSTAGAEPLSDDYQISRTPVTDRTISHHFVRGSSRANFYSAGLRRLKEARFIEQLGCGR
jgi:hypothetical protein